MEGPLRGRGGSPAGHPRHLSRGGVSQHSAAQGVRRVAPGRVPSHLVPPRSLRVRPITGHGFGRSLPRLKPSCNPHLKPPKNSLQPHPPCSPPHSACGRRSSRTPTCRPQRSRGPCRWPCGGGPLEEEEGWGGVMGVAGGKGSRLLAMRGCWCAGGGLGRTRCCE